MPALSYKMQFCPFVVEYSKTQTIRAFRKRPFKVGDTLSHFYAMRTASCTRLIENTTCSEIKTVFVFPDGRIFIGPNATFLNCKLMMETISFRIKSKSKKPMPDGVTEITGRERDLFAWLDGFRNEPYYTADNKMNIEGCYAKMIDFWKDTHALPFYGQLIKWEKP